ncbi:MAG: prolyl oligopeptidase family serine peptidase [Planctomycetota bacterium]
MPAAGGSAKRLTHTVEPEFEAHAWVAPEYVRVPGEGGIAIPARLYRPLEPSSAKRPAVLFVHGAGYLQNADRAWSYYQREFMFHTFLVQHGFVVLDMDYRASAGYGRDWRTAIWSGRGRTEDLQPGRQWLVANHGVDPERIGLLRRLCTAALRH